MGAFLLLYWPHGTALALAQRPARLRAAARHLSFTRAAEELNVTQTAISHQIRRLEEQLGLPLFVRRNRALELTREAESYLPAVRAAFEDLRRATARLRRAGPRRPADRQHDRVAGGKMADPPRRRFQDANPGIEVRITTSTHLVDFQREEVDWRSATAAASGRACAPIG